MMKVLELIFVCLFIISCTSNTKENKIIGFVSKWNGKIIKSSDLNLSKSNKLKVLVLVESNDYFEKNVDKWKGWLNKEKKAYADVFETIFVFEVRKSHVIDSILGCKTFVDLDKRLKRENKLPSKLLYNVFLLSEENKIILIGDPISGIKINELYLNEFNKRVRNFTAKVELSKLKIPLGNVKYHSFKKDSFFIKNVGSKPFYISKIIANCGCIKLEYDKRPLFSKEKRYIKLKYFGNSKGFFYKQIIINCNANRNPIQISVLGNVE